MIEVMKAILTTKEARSEEAAQDLAVKAAGDELVYWA